MSELEEEEATPIADLRESYEKRTLRRTDLVDDPFAQFHYWFEEAREANVQEPNAMSLATLGLDNIPTVRTVLLKDLDPRGFTFFTNYESRKAKEILATPAASLVFLWKELERQVIIRGRVERVSLGESENYFNSRPYESRIGAWASSQSSKLKNREALELRDREVRERFPDTGDEYCVPIPDYWGGYRVLPVSIEFWQGGPGRLHDRFEYERDHQGAWQITRLSP